MEVIQKVLVAMLLKFNNSNFVDFSSLIVFIMLKFYETKISINT
jgi:hypothetical protein